MNDIITHGLLKSWGPCEDGYKRFCELFPNGTDLQSAMDGLIKDDNESWAYWLFSKCRELKLFPEIILTGYRNTGYRNTGDCNTGDCNTGDRNTGYRNTGNWNTGDWNTGYFNVDEPKFIRIFGKECEKKLWEKTYKPNFLYFDLLLWVDESNMLEEEKVLHPSCSITGGFLKEMSYKEAFKLSWDNANKEDRIKVKDLPNFDAKIFEEISGIDVNKY